MDVEINFFDTEPPGDLIAAFEVTTANLSWLFSTPDGQSMTLDPGKYEIRRVGASDS